MTRGRVRALTQHLEPLEGASGAPCVWPYAPNGKPDSVEAMKAMDQLPAGARYALDYACARHDPGEVLQAQNERGLSEIDCVRLIARTDAYLIREHPHA